jgi:hypothetical protein
VTASRPTGGGPLRFCAGLGRRVRWVAWQRLGAHRQYLQVARRRPRRAVLGADTELVIEGFPRTGNTFAVVAFQIAQARPVPVAHHLHISGHVVAAAERGVPALVLIRPPEATVVSAMMWWPHVRARDALLAYAHFYERLLPLRDACVFAGFDEVTTDFGAVVERVNRRYGTDFAAFVHTERNVERCYRLIEERSARAPWGPMLTEWMSGRISAAQLEVARGGPDDVPAQGAPEMRVARPSAVRDVARDTLREQYRAARLDADRRRADRVYRDFVGA